MPTDSTDITFHYPPELFNLLVDAVPLLNKTKKDLLLFFTGAGVADDILDDLRRRLRADPKNINKFEITRTVLRRLNERGETTLRARRNVLRRVVEFTNFDACWPDDQLKAKGAVAGVRDIVNQKDSFTRMNLAREAERQARLAIAEKDRSARRKRKDKIDEAQRTLYALFSTRLTPQQRGKQLETALNRLFHAFDIAVHEAFHLVGDQGEGIVEQVDGVIELKGTLYFVEMKWHKEPVGKAQVAEHLVRLMGRDQARGLFISASDFTDPAIHVSREFLQQKVVALCHLQELVFVLDQQHDLPAFLNDKVQAAIIHKNPYFKPFDASVGRP
ncbi:MAG: restriction endonuclease [Acidobacteria bacterium]|nr:restriction endonuclease [Acidobacteriota bacterium]